MLHDLSNIDLTKEHAKAPEALLRALVNQNYRLRDHTVENLLAADSFMSKKALAYLADPIAGHSAAGHIGRDNRYFAGSHYIDKIDSLCHALCKELFQASYCEHRVLGGTQANMIVYLALLQAGDRLCSVSPHCGGDSSQHQPSILDHLDVCVDEIPFTKQLTIDFKALEQQFHQHRYRLLSLGFSVSLIQQDLPKLIKLCRQYQVLCHIDCAHELAFIAKGLFANPLSLGADLMTASTGKAFAGPPGGLILWQSHQFSKPIVNHTFPICVGAYQNNRVLALSQTCIEYKKGHKQYIEEALKLTDPFAEALENHGVPVARYGGISSQTHHLIIKCVQHDPRQLMHQLERNGILCSIANIPLSHQLGLRLSTIQLAMRGYGKKELNDLAEKIKKSYRNECNEVEEV